MLFNTCWTFPIRMQLNVDNTDTEDQPSASTFDEFGENITLGEGLFEGCLRNLYIRRFDVMIYSYCVIMTYIRNKPLIMALWFSLQSDYIPADLGSFNQTGNVSFGFCKAERPPLDTTRKRARHAGIISKSNSVFQMINLCI